MASVSEESEASDNDHWQVVKPTKRFHADSPPTQRKRVATSDPCTSSNRFEALKNNTDDNQNNEISEPRPPPIFIPDVADIKSMLNSFVKVIKPDEFTYKSLKDGQVRLMIKSIDSYRTLVKFLDEKKINFHTYQLKQERAYRVVVKNLHFSTPIELIKQEIEKSDHKVRNVVNVRSRVNKKPMSIFFVDLEPNNNNKDIYNIKQLFNAVVKIEPPLKNNDIVQCYRCQQFGHTKTYCRKMFKCVKCGLNHPTDQCTKNETTPPQCTNCLEPHTANYKGCEVYKNFLKMRNLVKRRNNHFDNNQAPDFDVNALYFPNISGNNGLNNNYYNSNQNSYSQTVKNSNHQNEALSSSFKRIEALMEKQIETTTTLLNMMSTLLTKLCN